MKKSFLSFFCAAVISAASISPATVHSAEHTGCSVSAETLNYYEDWKSAYLRKNDYITDEAQYYVFYGEQTYEQAHTEVPVTVSEAHGYGMLITALMSQYDSSAKDVFDGMYRYYLAHPSSIGPHLMAWQQSDNGSTLSDSNGSDSATDGDLDIAYALLIADSIWGSSDIDYAASAKLIINDIMKYDVNQEDYILRLGDWTYGVGKNDKYYSATRSSDFIMQYFPVFADVTGDDRWMKLYDSTYSIISQFTEEYKTGLLPDFIIRDNNGKWIPAPSGFLEDENDGNYYYNSCRTPWRISTDAYISRNETAQKYAETVNAFFRKETGCDPERIMAGYTPDGRPFSDWNDLCFTAPLMLSASCAGDTQMHDAVRSEVIDIGTDSYFGNSIAMLCLITDDGGWIVPEKESIAGDVNLDNEFSVADVILLQKWLLGVPDAELENWKAADLCKDGTLNAFDLCLMKQELTSD